MPRFMGPKVSCKCQKCGHVVRRAKRTALFDLRCPKCRQQMPHPRVFADARAAKAAGAQTLMRPTSTSTSTVAIALAVATAINVTALVTKARADIVIGNDTGGNVFQYQNRVNAARATGERVVIGGRCHSACTLWLTLPPSQVCAASRAMFGFHWAVNELGIPDPKANEHILAAYQPHVRNYILRQDGWWIKPFYVRGTVLAGRCR